MNQHTIRGRANTVKSFKEFNRKDKDKIAEIVETRQAEHWLSPIVEDYVYGTTRSLDVGDYEGVLTPKANWEWAVNKNADLFTYQELTEVHPEKNIERYLTFRTAALYKDHQSQSRENAIGLIFDSVLIKTDPDDAHVTCLFGLDKMKSANIARDLKNYPTRVPVSMGCSIKYSIATCCGKKIVKESDLCSHLMYQRGGRYQGRKVAELLKGVDFYELSVVASPACNTAYVIDAISDIVPGRLLKVAKDVKEGEENIRLMATIYDMIKNAKTISEKKRLSNQFDQLIYKLENIA